ncbi:tyrosine-type recombinase/integrase [Lysobacter soli]|uniref:tyrosine-type recombinase/integrase n=1 Tax=Lysobacter soli TaxID=453783 RepID=UPI00240F151B|nr:tyrosine-type recombinase/integrase [Lysobacter soli]MDG2519269.1 tyrosine-type recombinase/integrase [Lysobacter soli]
MTEHFETSLSSVPQCATESGRREIERRLVDALAQHAPDVLALEPGASWSPLTEAMIVSAALGPSALPADVHWVRRAIARLLDRGRQLGCWQWTGLTSSRQAKQERDRFSLINRADVDLAAERRDRLLTKLDSVLTCGDTRILKGALIVAAADLSAVLVPELLERIPRLFATSDRPVRSSANLAWINLPLGGVDTGAKKKTSDRAEWKITRRFILDDVSIRLAIALTQFPHNAQASADACLKAFATYVDLPTVSVAALCRTARSRMALLLDEASYRYATTMILAPSLPDHVFTAFLDGTRRRAAAVPQPHQAAPGAADVDAPADLLTQDDADEAADTSGMEVDMTPLVAVDLARQLEAAAALKRVFGKFVGGNKPRPNLDQLRRRLEAWNRDHRKVGGWVVLMADWARAAIDSSYLPGTARSAEWKSVHRYLTGFAVPFLSRLAHVAPDRLKEGSEDELDAFADGFELLRDQLARRGGASTDKEGLRQFVRFVRAVGGPQIHLDSSWRIVVSACEADANILTEREYTKVLASLGQRGPSDGYPVARARVMTILAYRLGLRWEELQTRRLDDIKLIDGHATLWVRRNPYFRGKTRASIRKIPIELLLTPEELQEVSRFIELAQNLAPTPASDHFLFADSYDLTRPPATTMTHDWIVAAMRHETGDPTLVFHHLRHSAATHLFARLMIASPAPWAIADWKRTRGPGMDWAELACGLTGRSPTDASRLFAVSKLLGHSEPTTTMRYYIHLADLALASIVHRGYTGPAGDIAKREGIKRSSVYKERSRERNRRDKRT